MTFARRPCRLKRAIPDSLVVSRGAGSPHVGLTFDDGPHPRHTTEVLALLRAHDVRATFFLVGKRLAHAPDVARRVVEQGHALGNHSDQHSCPSWWNLHAAGRDVQNCQDAIALATGFRATEYRPPFGRLTPATYWAARRRRLRVVTWSLDSGDWRCRSTADATRCAAEFLARVRPNDIALFHDDHPYIAAILEIVLPALQLRGLLAPGSVSDGRLDDRKVGSRPDVNPVPAA